jgi:ABC-type antimicrobial peptide transport system permease subunit
MKGSYLGPRDLTEDIEAYLVENNIPYIRYPREELPDVVAGYLAEEKVVGLHQGRMEFGPRALAEPLRLRFFLGLFAALALVLGVVGVYSVVSYAVARRQGEFGVRMALGAAGATVARQVVARGLFPVAIGTGAGVALVLLLGRVAGRFLYGVSPADPASLIGASAALLLAGVLASAVPAWRAASVSPVEALRAE